MIAKIKKCPLRGEAAPRSRRPADLQTAQAFQQFQLHAEEQALALAVRLRVLGKSLSAGCQERGGSTDKEAQDFQSLRRQLENYLVFLVGLGFDNQPYFPPVRHYLQDSLPLELYGCAGNHCSIERVETLISLLSEGIRGKEDDFFEEPVSPFSQ
jgi:hypothetical protein